MKKFTLLSLIVAVSFSMFGQNLANYHSVKKLNTTDKYASFVELKKFSSQAELTNALRAYGDTIAYDDFGTGGPGADDLPTGWSSADVDPQGNNYTWKWTDVGAQGPTTAGYEHVLASTSAANGWLILDSDNNGLGTYDSYLYSPSYNCSNYSSVAVVFQELYKRWGNETMNGNPTYVGISVDNGVSWAEYEIHEDFESKESTDNPGIYMLNISTVAGSQADVKVYFRMLGSWDYWWQIDDFAVIEGPQNEIAIAEVTNAWFDGNYGYVGSFSKLPFKHIFENVCYGDVYSNGEILQTGVTLEATITNSMGTVVFNESDDTIQLSFTDTADLFIETTFTPATPDVYTVSFQAYQDQTDELPLNNIADTISWEITANKTMARDRQDERYNGGTVGPSGFTGGLGGDFVGVNYNLAETDTAHSLSVFIDHRTTIGTTIYGQIYSGDIGGTPIEQVAADELDIEGKHLGTWVTLPLVTSGGNEDILDPAVNYICGVECYYVGDEEVLLGDEGEGYPHQLWNESVVRIGTQWSWISNALPYVRLNLNGAILPPEFTSMPELECGTNANYSYTAAVTDPQGLPVTLTAMGTNPDLQITGVDNGNGTITVTTGVTPGSLGYTDGDRFVVSITADNGTAKNLQYYYVTVLDGIFVTETAVESPINIFPNPSTGILNIENAVNSTISVFNIIGEEIITVDQATQNTKIDLSKYAEGTYIVRVVSENNVVSKKINLIK